MVLRAANQNSNDCRWQSYHNVAQTGVAIPRYFRTLSETHVIANQRRNAGVAIRNPCLPFGVVLRAANQNLTIASGNCTIMYRWHGIAVTDEGNLPLPMGEVPGQGGEGDLYPLSHFVTAPPEWEPRGKDGLPRQCAHCLAMTCFFDSLPAPGNPGAALFY